MSSSPARPPFSKPSVFEREEEVLMQPRNVVEVLQRHHRPRGSFPKGWSSWTAGHGNLTDPGRGSRRASPPPRHHRLFHHPPVDPRAAAQPRDRTVANRDANDGHAHETRVSHPDHRGMLGWSNATAQRASASSSARPVAPRYTDPRSARPLRLSGCATGLATRRFVRNCRRFVRAARIRLRPPLCARM